MSLLPPPPPPPQHRPSPHSLAVAALIALHHRHDGDCDGEDQEDSCSPLYYYSSGSDAGDADEEEEEEDDNNNNNNNNKRQQQLVFAARVERVLQNLLLLRDDDGDPPRVEDGDGDGGDSSNNNNAPTVQSLLKLLPKTVATRLRGWLQVASETVDSLIDFVASLQQDCSTTTAAAAAASSSGGGVVVDVASVHGAYLRSAVLGFEELSFPRVLELWRALRREVRIDNNNTTTTSTWTRSAPQLEQSLRRAALQLGGARQRSSSSSSADAQMQTQTMASAVLRHHPELPAAHFVEFLQALEAGERVGAVHALHRYLDYALIWQAQQREQQEQERELLLENAAAAADGETAANTATDDDDHYNSNMHVLLLSLAPVLNAVLHETFGEDALLESAVHEAVRVAQQQQSSNSSDSGGSGGNHGNSSECTAFALGWLGVLATTSSGNTAVPLLQRCVERCDSSSNNNSLRALQAGALLEQAARTHDWRPWQAATADRVGGGGTTAGAADRGSSNNATTAAGACGDRPMALALSNNNNGEDPLWISRQHLVASGLWHHRGQGWLAAHATRAVLGNSSNKNKNALSSSDCAGAIRNASVSLLSGGGDSCDARRLLWNNEHNNDDSNDNDCVYGNALRALVRLRDAHQLPVGGGDTFLLEAALLVHEWAVRRHQFDEAEAVLVECFSHEHPHTTYSTGSSRECARLEICSQRAFLRSRQGRHREARDLLTREISRLQAAPDSSSSSKTCQQQQQQQHHRARLLLQLSLVHLECCRQQQQQSSNNNSSSSNNRCTAVLAPLLECLTLSERLGMTGLHAEALSVLGRVHWRHGDCRRAVAVVRAALPQLLQPGGTHVALQAEAYYTLARCHVDLAENNNSTNKKQTSSNNNKRSSRQQHLKRAVREFRRAERGFAACHDVERLKETCYWQARTYHALSRVSERDAAAARFVRLSSWSTNSSSSNNNNNGPSSSYDYPNPLTSLSNRDDLLKLASRPGPAAAVAM